jgi:hypothetical protein
MTILDIHDRMGNTALLFTIVMTVWGLWRYFRRQGVGSSYWGALVIAEIVYLVQDLIGVVMIAGGTTQPLNPLMHILYGVVDVLVLPGIFFFTHGDDKRRASLIYSFGFLFLIGISLRLRATGI